MLLAAEDLFPVQEPTIIDVCSFQEALANALAQCTSYIFFEENIRHSFLIESSINYQARTGLTALPEWPIIPVAPVTAVDTLQLRLQETQQKSYVICSRLDNEVKRLLQTKFPGMLNAHFVRRTRYLPPLMQAREALEKIRAKVHSPPRASHEQQGLLKQVLARTYTPSITGAEMYFYACETDQLRSRHLVIEPISDTMITTAALCAFSLEHHGEQLQCIAESWSHANSTVASPQDEYDRFKDHYNRRLADLYNHNHNPPRAVQEQAHSVVDTLAEHNEWLFDLESQWNGTASVRETLAPSRVTTTTQALSATDTLL